MSTPHIPLPQRKSLCGRLAYFQTFLESEVEILSGGDASSAERLQTYLFEQFNIDTVNDLDQKIREPGVPLIPLDEALRSSVENVKASLKPLRLDGDAIITSRVLPVLEAKVAEISCAKCASSHSGKICDGVNDAADDLIVSDAGLCISSLKQLFNVAYEAALAYYSNFGAFFPQTTSPEVKFSTSYSSFQLSSHYSMTDSLVGAVTNFLPPLMIPRVQLQLTVSRLDLETYKRILYLLFHECIAHAFHGIHPDPKKRTGTEPYDSFAEGWMDFVSYKIFEEVVKGTGFAGRRWDTTIKIPDVFEVASELHRKRATLSGRAGTAQIRLGVMVAALTLNFIKDYYEQGFLDPFDGYWAAFYRLSFDLNLLSDISAEKRNAFVNCVRQLGFENDNRNDARLLLVQYLRTGDIYQLVHDAYIMDQED